MNSNFKLILKLNQRIILLLIFLFSSIFTSSFIQAEEYSPYGVMAHFERPEFYSDENIDQACKLMKDAGIQWIYTCFNWIDIEREKGQFDFSRIDKIVDITSSYNLKLLPLVWYCPKWAEDYTPVSDEFKNKSYLYPPKDVEEFANFVYHLAKRYKGKIKYWQIWGEENMTGRWLPEPDPEEYLSLLKAAYVKIKEADPDSKIVLGGLALQNLEDFLEKLYQLGGKDYFDVVAINPYVHPIFDYDPYLEKEGDPIELVKDWIFKVRQIMAKYDDSLKPLWITEIGSPGQEEPGEWWLLETTPSEIEQAEWVKRVYIELLEEDLADKIFWYNFRTPPDELDAQAGLLGMDYQVKPAYLTYKALPKFKEEQGLNIFLISVDCLRPDHLGCYGYGRPTSPTLDGLAQEGVKFTQTISVAPWTSPSLISLLTSFYPLVHGVDGRAKYLPQGIPTPIKILKRSGYLVPGISYIHTVLNYQNLGFDVVKEPTQHEEKNEEIRINEWLEKNYRQKFFFWHHFYTPHLPYNPLPKYRKLFINQNEELSEDLKHKLELIRTQPVIREGMVDFKKEDIPYIISLYDAEIRQLDDQVESIINKLKELGILYKTILIITADHGEEFLEHENIGHASTTLAASLYDECIRIPLIFWNPRVLPQGKTIYRQIQNIDIMPTIFSLLNLEMDIPVDGKSLLPLIQNRQSGPLRKYAFSDTTPGGFQSTEEQEKGRIRSIRTKDWKLIHYYTPGKEYYLLFNLKKDSLEGKNVFKKQQQIVQNLIFQLRKWTFTCLTKKSWFKIKGEEEKVEKIPKELLDKVPTPKILSPLDGSELEHEKTNGKVILKWEGDYRLWYIVEYDIGKGNLRMKGSFPVKGTEQQFGPIPKDVWELLPTYNPWKIRVKVRDRKKIQSDWVTFKFHAGENKKQVR